LISSEISWHVRGFISKRIPLISGKFMACRGIHQQEDPLNFERTSWAEGGSIMRRIPLDFGSIFRIDKGIIGRRIPLIFKSNLRACNHSVDFGPFFSDSNAINFNFRCCAIFVFSFCIFFSSFFEFLFVFLLFQFEFHFSVFVFRFVEILSL
jgi:hypothetical protein